MSFSSDLYLPPPTFSIDDKIRITASLPPSPQDAHYPINEPHTLYKPSRHIIHAVSFSSPPPPPHPPTPTPGPFLYQEFKTSSGGKIYHNSLISSNSKIIIHQSTTQPPTPTPTPSPLHKKITNPSFNKQPRLPSPHIHENIIHTFSTPSPNHYNPSHTIAVRNFPLCSLDRRGGIIMKKDNSTRSLFSINDNPSPTSYYSPSLKQKSFSHPLYPSNSPTLPSTLTLVKSIMSSIPGPGAYTPPPLPHAPSQTICKKNSLPLPYPYNGNNYPDLTKRFTRTFNPVPISKVDVASIDEIFRGRGRGRSSSLEEIGDGGRSIRDRGRAIRVEVPMGGEDLRSEIYQCEDEKFGFKNLSSIDTQSSSHFNSSNNE